MKYRLQTLASPLHRMALSEIDRRRIAELLGTVEVECGPVQRNRLRANLSALWNWLVREGLLDLNVVAGTGTAVENQSRSRVLTASEIAKLWVCLGTDPWGDVIRLLLLTGQRREEIAALRWSEIDWDRGLIVFPPERVKNNREHSLPLSSQALSILRSHFQSAKDGRNDRVFSSVNWAKRKLRLDHKMQVADWRVHDLRRTCATGMAELGVLPHVIEAVLNHVSGHKGGVAGIYNRARYEGEMRQALELWAAHVEALIVGPRKQPVTGLMERAFAVARGGKIIPNENLANLTRELKNN